MDDNNSANVDPYVTRLGGKSWTAYVRIGLYAVLLLLIAVLVAWSISIAAGCAVLATSLAFLVYQFLMLKSFRLYFDDSGVWVYSGILPWKKGVAGVKWRDLDEATYFQSIGSWLFKSYSIRIGHRFTKSSEILLSHWARGHEAVVTINERHKSLVRSSSLN